MTVEMMIRNAITFGYKNEAEQWTGCPVDLVNLIRQ